MCIYITQLRTSEHGLREATSKAESLNSSYLSQNRIKVNIVRCYQFGILVYIDEMTKCSMHEEEN